MYDTKKKELRWNATYFDYAATLPDEDIKYSKNLIAVSLLQWGFVYRQKYSDFFCAVHVLLPIFIHHILQYLKPVR